MVGRLWLGGVPGNYKPSSWRVGGVSGHAVVFRKSCVDVRAFTCAESMFV